MFGIAAGILKGYDITLKDQAGHTNAKDIVVESVPEPEGGRASFDFMDKNDIKPHAENEIAVLFATDIVRTGGCAEGVGCTRPATHQIMIPEQYEGAGILFWNMKGFASILGHEIGHNFGLDKFPKSMGTNYYRNLMEEDSSLRGGYFIPDAWRLQQGGLP